ncbi:MAG TPA: amidohydrolase [Acetobacteraceae bacterium]|nr:amidohydrolase [Acetobacteraceae bacterium]
MDEETAARLGAWRRHLHAHPELSTEERETAAFVAARLDEMGIPFVAGVGGHGVVATLSRPGSERSVALRADMDALPIPEETNLAHASTRPGVMHACGHDGHTASLLGAALLLARDASWRGTVRLVFQPAEEGGGGARAMLADGLIERFPFERIFGFHNWPGLEAGTVMVHPGPVMAAGRRFSVTLQGKAAHAALPHLAKDPMLAAAHLMLALQSIVARNVSPLDAAVVTIGMIEAGNAPNQIPETATLRGTFRSYREEVHELIDGAIRRIAEGIAASFGMTAEIAMLRGNLATINTREEAELAAAAAAAAGLSVRRDLAPSMTGEDFSWYLQKKPGTFAWIGNGTNEGGRDLHSPHYDFNDAILPAAATFLAASARAALEE